MLSRDQILAQMRERVHHPAGTRELLQLLKIPREERAVVQASSQVARRVGRPHSDSRPALRAAREDGPPRRAPRNASGRATASSCPNGRSDDGGDIYIVGRAPRAKRCTAIASSCASSASRTAAASRAASSASSSRKNTLAGRPLRSRRDGMGFVVPFDRRVLMDILVPAGQEGGASPGEMVTVELTRWPTATRGADRSRRRRARRHRRAGRRHRNHHPQVRHPRRALRRKPSPKRCASAAHGHRQATFAGGPTSAICRPSRSTASTRAISTMRSRSTSCRTAITGSACTSPTCRTTSGRQRARPRGVRARHVGVLSRSAPCTCFRPNSPRACAA